MAFANLLLVAPTVVLVLLASTYVWTSIRYKLALRGAKSLHEPAHLPYLIPWLGSSLDFLNPTVGGFYSKLFARHPRDMGACTVLLGGESRHLLNSPRAVQAMFKLKNEIANRDGMNRNIMLNCCGMSAEDYVKYGPAFPQDHQLSHEYLLRQTNANELGVEFARCYRDVLLSGVRAMRQNDEPRRQADLYSWLSTNMFQASVTTYMGELILKSYPDFAKDFATWDRGFLDLMFGLGKFMAPEAYAAREKAITGMTKWIQAMDERTEGKCPDPNSPDVPWEPNWGSRLSRGRQALWHELGLSQRGRASAELGLSFGLNSNAIPATGWMLMHILDPQTPDLLPRVRAEIKPAVIVNADESITLDIQKLASQPLLQSIFHETLRCYTDVLVTRELFEDVKLPLDDDKDSPRSVLLKKGSTVMAPSLMTHWDPTYYLDPPADVFHAERFLAPANAEKKETGEYVFSTAAAGNRMWPWGGGKTICPGRLFAKQEALAAVALTLMSFEIEPVDKTSYKIPGLAKAKPGSGSLCPGGDVKVWLKPRSQTKG